MFSRARGRYGDETALVRRRPFWGQAFRSTFRSEPHSSIAARVSTRSSSSASRCRAGPATRRRRSSRGPGNQLPPKVGDRRHGLAHEHGSGFGRVESRSSAWVRGDPRAARVRWRRSLAPPRTLVILVCDILGFGQPRDEDPHELRRRLRSDLGPGVRHGRAPSLVLSDEGCAATGSWRWFITRGSVPSSVRPWEVWIRGARGLGPGCGYRTRRQQPKPLKNDVMPANGPTPMRIRATASCVPPTDRTSDPASTTVPSGAVGISTR